MLGPYAFVLAFILKVIWFSSYSTKKCPFWGQLLCLPLLDLFKNSPSRIKTMLLYCAHMESGGSGNSFQNLYVLFVVTFFLKLIALAMQHIEELFKNESWVLLFCEWHWIWVSKAKNKLTLEEVHSNDDPFVCIPLSFIKILQENKKYEYLFGSFQEKYWWKVLRLPHNVCRLLIR